MICFQFPLPVITLLDSVANLLPMTPDPYIISFVTLRYSNIKLFLESFQICNMMIIMPPNEYPLSARLFSDILSNSTNNPAK